MVRTSILQLDTHAAFRRLVEAGATEDLARAIVDVHVGMLKTRPATFSDLSREITSFKRTIILCVGGCNVALFSLIVAMVKGLI